MMVVPPAWVSILNQVAVSELSALASPVMAAAVMIAPGVSSETAPKAVALIVNVAMSVWAPTAVSASTGWVSP